MEGLSTLINLSTSSLIFQEKYINLSIFHYQNIAKFFKLFFYSVAMNSEI